MIPEINWGNFRAKFNGKEQSSFEWLCSLLFYKQYKQKFGAQRYKNQTGIEANPIKVNDEIIGWQAKFISTNNTGIKNELMKAIDNAKNKNPTITKLVFYLNDDFSESSKKGVKDPKYKTAVEKHAESKSIKVEWRTASFFQSPFVCEENAKIAQYFFSLEKSTIDFIDQLSLHAESILEPIRSEIVFNGNKIKIDRSKILGDLKNALAISPLVILSGEAGVGKTAVIKDFYDSIKNVKSFFVFKATEFNISNVNELFRGYGNFTLADFVNEHQEIDEKYVVIDSAEKLSDIEHQEVFREFLSALLKSNWKIIFTTRYSYLDDLKYQFIEVYNLKFHPLNITNLTTAELTEFSKIHKFSLPENERLYKLLQNPFYLNEYLQNYGKTAVATSYSDFKNIIWNKQIAKTSYQKDNTHRKREECFLEVANERAIAGHFFVKAQCCEHEILKKLESDEIIKYDTNAGGYFITHDIYEEWALDIIIVRIPVQSSRPFR